MRPRPRTRWIVIALASAASLAALTGCGSSGDGADASIDVTVPPTTPTEAVPDARHGAAVVAGDITVDAPPEGLELVRDYRIPHPMGGVAHVLWFGAPDRGPTFTVNASRGPGIADRLDDAQARSAVQQETATQMRRTPPFAAVDIVVRGAPGVVYGDLLGWTCVRWAPAPDLVLSATGWRMEAATLLEYAAGVHASA